MKKLHCDLCNSLIEIENGEGYIKFKGKEICTQCAIDLIEAIYEHDICSGGLIKLVFDKLAKHKNG